MSVAVHDSSNAEGYSNGDLPEEEVDGQPEDNTGLVPVYVSAAGQVQCALWYVPEAVYSANPQGHFLLTDQAFSPDQPAFVLTGQQLAVRAGCEEPQLWAMHTALAVTWADRPAGCSLHEVQEQVLANVTLEEMPNFAPPTAEVLAQSWQQHQQALQAAAQAGGGGGVDQEDHEQPAADSSEGGQHQTGLQAAAAAEQHPFPHRMFNFKGQKDADVAKNGAAQDRKARAYMQLKSELLAAGGVWKEGDCQIRCERQGFKWRTIFHFRDRRYDSRVSVLKAVLKSQNITYQQPQQQLLPLPGLPTQATATPQPGQAQALRSHLASLTASLPANQGMRLPPAMVAAAPLGAEEQRHGSLQRATSLSTKYSQQDEEEGDDTGSGDGGASGAEQDMPLQISKRIRNVEGQDDAAVQRLRVERATKQLRQDVEAAGAPWLPAYVMINCEKKKTGKWHVVFKVRNRRYDSRVSALQAMLRALEAERKWHPSSSALHNNRSGQAQAADGTATILTPTSLSSGQQQAQPHRSVSGATGQGEGEGSTEKVWEAARSIDARAATSPLVPGAIKDMDNQQALVHGLQHLKSGLEEVGVEYIAADWAVHCYRNACNGGWQYSYRYTPHGVAFVKRTRALEIAKQMTRTAQPTSVPQPMTTPAVSGSQGHGSDKHKQRAALLVQHMTAKREAAKSVSAGSGELGGSQLPAATSQQLVSPKQEASETEEMDVETRKRVSSLGTTASHNGTEAPHVSVKRPRTDQQDGLAEPDGGAAGGVFNAGMVVRRHVAGSSNMPAGMTALPPVVSLQGARQAAHPSTSMPSTPVIGPAASAAASEHDTSMPVLPVPAATPHGDVHGDMQAVLLPPAGYGQGAYMLPSQTSGTPYLVGAPQHPYTLIPMSVPPPDTQQQHNSVSVPEGSLQVAGAYQPQQEYHMQQPYVVLLGPSNVGAQGPMTVQGTNSLQPSGTSSGVATASVTAVGAAGGEAAAGKLTRLPEPPDQASAEVQTGLTRALFQLLKEIGCPAAVRQLVHRMRTHYGASEQGMQEFLMHYLNIWAAVDAQDEAFVKEVFREDFKLPACQ